MTVNDPPIPVVHTIEVNPGSHFGQGLALDFTTPGFASFVMITNAGPTPVNVMLNSLSTAVFTLGEGTMTFDSGDLYITNLDFDQPTLSVSPVYVEVLAGVKHG